MSQIEEQKTWSQIFAIIAASLGPLTTGVLFSWTSPTIPKIVFEEYEGEISLQQASYLTIIPALAVIVFSPFTAQLIDVIGRKKVMLFMVVPQIMFWVLTAVGGSIECFYAARILNGLADSCSFAVIPTYISEVATPKVRGTWGNALTFAIFFGSVLINIVGAYMSIRNASLIFLTIPILFFVITLFVPETPYYLLMKGKQEQAKESLQWLRRIKNVDDELKQLTADVQRQLSEPGSFKDLVVIASNRKAVTIGVSVRVMQQFSGVSAIIMYSQLIFREAGGNISASSSAIIVSVVTLVSNFVTSLVLDKLGRRPMILVSCLGSCLTLGTLATYFYLKSETLVDLSDFKLLPIITLLLYTVFFSMGLGIIPTLMLGELFSSSIKGKALCMTNIFFGVSMFLSSQIFSVLLMSVGMYAAFYFFAVCCVISIFGSYYLVPETKGKTLEEIQQGFKSKKPTAA